MNWPLLTCGVGIGALIGPPIIGWTIHTTRNIHGIYRHFRTSPMTWTDLNNAIKAIPTAMKPRHTNQKDHLIK